MEVLTKKKVPSGVWRGAEIVADNGESYTVRHYRRPGVLSDVVEKVSVEAVRPCPPRGNGPVIWAVGDIVEVLDNGYWKTAEIQQVMDGGYYIHLIGSIDEFRVEKSSIRARQEWLDNRWVLIEKDSGIRKDMICRAFKKDHAHYGLESAISKSRKRLSPDNSAFDEAQPECVQKRRAIEKDELEIMHGDSYSFNGKDMCRHVSLTATCAKMMLWLANSLLASRKGHHLCLLLADKAIGV